MSEFIQERFNQVFCWRMLHFLRLYYSENIKPKKVEPELDFGIVRTHDEKRTLPLNIINSGENARDAQIDWIRQMEQPKESFLKLHFQPIKVPPFSKQSPRPHNIANLTFTFDQKQVEKHGVRDFSGTIKVHVKNMALPVKYNSLEIPWKATMLDGHLDIADVDRRFILSEMREDGITSREVRVHNTLRIVFKYHAIIFAISLTLFLNMLLEKLENR